MTSSLSRCATEDSTKLKLPKIYKRILVRMDWKYTLGFLGKEESARYKFTILETGRIDGHGQRFVKFPITQNPQTAAHFRRLTIWI